ATPMSLTTVILPILPVRKLDGSYAGPIGTGFTDRMNPVFLADLDRDDVNNDFQTFGNVYIDVTPIPILVLRSNFVLDYIENFDENIERTFTHGFIARTINSYSVAQRHRLNWTWSNTANYTINFNQSRLNILAGMEAIKNTTKVAQTIKRG